jgi:hypothetical protein
MISPLMYSIQTCKLAQRDRFSIRVMKRLMADVAGDGSDKL